jgi:peptide/nickel transport system substrate-binding protein
MRRLLTVVLVFGLIGSVSALAGPADNSIILGAGQEPPTMERWVVNLAIAVEMMRVFNPDAVMPQPDGSYRGIVFTEAPTVENGLIRNVTEGGQVVRQEVTYRIRPEAVWSDGVPITSEDFRLWLEVQNDPRIPVPSRAVTSRYTLRIVDAKNFVATVDPAYHYSHTSVLGYVPAHFWKPHWDNFNGQTAGLDLQRDAPRIRELAMQFVAQGGSPSNLPKVPASGAFRVVQWSPGAFLRLERNPRFWIKPPGDEANYARTILYRFIPNLNTLAVNVLGGSVDTVPSVGLGFSDGQQFARSARGRFETLFVTGAVWEHIDLNQFSENQRGVELTLQDKRTRQALLYAINREEITDALWDGLQPVSHSWINPLSPVYHEGIKQYSYDPERARALLREVGWTPGPDGILQRQVAGRTVRFEIDFVTTAGNIDRERAQARIVQQLRDVGVAVRVNNAAATVVFSADHIYNARGGAWTGMFMFAWVSNAGIPSAQLFASVTPLGASNVPPPAGQLVGGWINPRFDEIFLASEREFDPARRAQLFRQMQELWAEEMPTLPLFVRSTPITRANGLLNYTFNGFTQYTGYNAWNWGWQQRGAQLVDPDPPGVTKAN